MSIITSFEALLLLHAIGVVRAAVEKRSLRIIHVYLEGTLTGPLLQIVRKEWHIVFEKASLSRLSSAISPYMYMWNDELQACFLVVLKCAGGCLLLWQKEGWQDVRFLLKELERVK